MPNTTRNKARFFIIAILSLGVLFSASMVCSTQSVVSPPKDELAMIIAASTGNLDAVKRLLNKGMNLDHSDFTGNTPLIYAARYARVALVEYLLRHGADVNAYTHWGTTALIEAVRKGNRVVVKDLLNAGADVNQFDNKHESALFDAVKYRRLWAVNMLLYRNAEVSIRNDKGFTPLRYAIEEHQPQIVAVLKNNDAGDGLSARDDMSDENRPIRMHKVNANSFGHPVQSLRINPVSLNQ